MKKTFRVRPCNNNTIDELTNSYLWFSRPTQFKGDTNDSNIGAFVTDTEAIKRGILYLYPNFQFEEWFKRMSYTGLCCFTKVLPTNKRLKHFPKCSNGNCVCIEFDKDELEKSFISHTRYPIYPCFNEVVYSPKPTKIDTCDEWSILWKILEDGNVLYKTIPAIWNEHPRERDKFFRMLLTRLNSRFEYQKEERIILGGRNIPPHTEKTTGYRINIPPHAILKIHIYPNVDKEFIKRIRSINAINEKIILKNDIKENQNLL